MAWYSPDSLWTRLFDGDPATILLALVVTITLPVLLHFYLFTTSPKAALPRTFLLLGPSGAGKTSLVSLLQRRSANPDTAETSPTRTSQTPSNATLYLSPSIRLGSNKYRSENDVSLQDAAKNPARYKLLDTPGHGKLRAEQGLLHLQDNSIRGLMFVVDASVLDSGDSAAARDTAAYLHDALLALQRRKTSKDSAKARAEIPVLIAANKQDLFTALPTGAVKERLQTEIERVRVSRSKGLSTVGQESDEVGENDILGGGGEEKFSFNLMKEEYGIEIDVLGGAVRGEEAGKGVRRWEEWIGGCL